MGKVSNSAAFRRAFGGAIPGRAPNPAMASMGRQPDVTQGADNPLANATVSMPAKDMSKLAAGAVKLGAKAAQTAMRRGAPAQASAPAAMPPPPPMQSGIPAMKNGGPLTAARRNALPSDDFALPGRRYPINDANHARNALARVSQHGTPAEKSKVRAAVSRDYPGIGKAEGGSVGAKERGQSPYASGSAQQLNEVDRPERRGVISRGLPRDAPTIPRGEDWHDRLAAQRPKDYTVDQKALIDPPPDRLFPMPMQDPRQMARPPKEIEAKNGGRIHSEASEMRSDAAQDKALIKKAVRQHETAEHGGRHAPLKLKDGGSLDDGMADHREFSRVMPDRNTTREEWPIRIQQADMVLERMEARRKGEKPVERPEGYPAPPGPREIQGKAMGGPVMRSVTTPAIAGNPKPVRKATGGRINLGDNTGSGNALAKGGMAKLPRHMKSASLRSQSPIGSGAMPTAQKTRTPVGAAPRMTSMPTVAPGGQSPLIGGGALGQAMRRGGRT